MKKIIRFIWREIGKNNLF